MKLLNLSQLPILLLSCVLQSSALYSSTSSEEQHELFPLFYYSKGSYYVTNIGNANFSCIKISKDENVDRYSPTVTDGQCVFLYAGSDCQGPKIVSPPGFPTWFVYDDVGSFGPCPPAKPSVVSLFEKSHFTNLLVKYGNVAGCKNLPSSVDKRINSVHTHGTCVRLFEYRNCQGQMVEVKPTSLYHWNLAKFGFANRASSISWCEGCSSFELQAKIVRFRFTNTLKQELLNAKLFRVKLASADRVVNNGTRDITRQFIKTTRYRETYRFEAIESLSRLHKVEVGNNIAVDKGSRKFTEKVASQGSQTVNGQTGERLHTEGVETGNAHATEKVTSLGTQGGHNQAVERVTTQGGEKGGSQNVGRVNSHGGNKGSSQTRETMTNQGVENGNSRNLGSETSHDVIHGRQRASETVASKGGEEGSNLAIGRVASHGENRGNSQVRETVANLGRNWGESQDTETMISRGNEHGDSHAKEHVAGRDSVGGNSQTMETLNSQGGESGSSSGSETTDTQGSETRMSVGAEVGGGASFMGMFSANFNVKTDLSHAYSHSSQNRRSSNQHQSSSFNNQQKNNQHSYGSDSTHNQDRTNSQVYGKHTSQIQNRGNLHSNHGGSYNKQNRGMSQYHQSSNSQHQNSANVNAHNSASFNNLNRNSQQDHYTSSMRNHNSENNLAHNRATLNKQNRGGSEDHQSSSFQHQNSANFLTHNSASFNNQNRSSAQVHHSSSLHAQNRGTHESHNRLSAQDQFRVRLDKQDQISSQFENREGAHTSHTASLGSHTNEGEHFEGRLSDAEEWTKENLREFVTNEQFTVPPCVVYEMDMFMLEKKNMPLEFELEVQFSEAQGCLTADQLRTHLPTGMEYVRDLDEFAIVAKTKGRIIADMGIKTEIEVHENPIPECLNRIALL